MAPISPLCACPLHITSLVDRVCYSRLKPRRADRCADMSIQECAPVLGYRRLWSDSEQSAWGRMSEHFLSHRLQAGEAKFFSPSGDFQSLPSAHWMSIDIGCLHQPIVGRSEFSNPNLIIILAWRSNTQQNLRGFPGSPWLAGSQAGCPASKTPLDHRFMWRKNQLQLSP